MKIFKNIMENSNETKKEYEITYLLKCEDAGVIHNTLTKQKAEIISEKQSVKMTVEYLIKKQTQAFLGVICFKSEPNQISQLSSALKLESDVLRFLITNPIAKVKKQTFIQNQVKNSEFIKFEEKGITPSQSVIKRQKRESEMNRLTLTNKAIEKKIEEISQ